MLFRDFINVSSVLVFFFIILYLIKSHNELTSVISLLRKFVILSSTIVAVLGLAKLYIQLLGYKFDFLIVEEMGYPSGASLAIDDNFSSLFCLFGIIFCLPLLLKKHSFYHWLLIQLVLFLLLFNIFLSTSRRGIIFAYGILLVFVIIWFLSVFHKNEKFKKFRNNSFGFGIFSVIAVSIIAYLVLFVPSLERNKRLAFSNYDQGEVQYFVNLMTLSINSIFKGEAEYQNISERIWQTTFDPRYPYTGWASGNYSQVPELTGENIEILPEGAMGAMIDKTVSNTFWNGNAYYHSKLFEKEITHGERYLASVYCYVSPDFNGDLVGLFSEGNIKGFKRAHYDLKQKGNWHKMLTSFYADSGFFSTGLYISKLKANSFDSLNGYIIFAYPELRKINFDPRQPITWAGDSFDEVKKLPGQNSEIVPSGSAAFKFNSYIYKAEDSIQYALSHLCSFRENVTRSRNIVSIYAYVSEDFNGDEVYLRASGKHFGLGIYNYNLANKGKWEKLFLSISPEASIVNINFHIKKNITEKYDTLRGTVLFAYPEYESLEFNPENPLTWADNKYKEVQNIQGENSKIVPIIQLAILLTKRAALVKDQIIMLVLQEQAGTLLFRVNYISPLSIVMYLKISMGKGRGWEQMVKFMAQDATSMI